METQNANKNWNNPKENNETYTLALTDIKTHYNKDKVTMKQRQKSETTHQHTIT